MDFWSNSNYLNKTRYLPVLQQKEDFFVSREYCCDLKYCTLRNFHNNCFRNIYEMVSIVFLNKRFFLAINFVSFGETYLCMNLSFGFFDRTHQIHQIWIFRSYVTIQNFTMSCTVYYLFDHNSSRTSKNISCISATCRSKFCEAPMELFGNI